MKLILRTTQGSNYYRLYTTFTKNKYQSQLNKAILPNEKHELNMIQCNLSSGQNISLTTSNETEIHPYGSHLNEFNLMTL